MLDVESFFTNDPVQKIIGRIWNVYKYFFCKLFLYYTTHVHFYDQYGNIYKQTDGIDMGSPLNPT